MRILVIADPHIPVPPTRYGGTERIIDLMCRGLAQRGHGIRLLAGPGSADYGDGLVVHRAPSPAWRSRAFRKLYFQALMFRAVRGMDLVINHGRLDYLEALYRTARPVVHWFHNPLTGREVDYVRSRRQTGDRFVAVSRAQIARDPAASAFTVIHNAVPVAAIPFSAAPDRPPYVLFLGRLTRNKGVHVAIAAARRAGVRLILAGNIPQEDGAGAYFESEIKPHLGVDCEWVGVYDETERNRLLAGAAALLFPIQWPEPFGIVMIEALAAGVPVIAMRRASTPEVIVHGRNGFLCETEAEMAAAIGRLGGISRAACRDDAEDRFGERAFVDRVESFIQQTAAA